jgi:Concanavalin A-like lectin/glucanases superfamily
MFFYSESTEQVVPTDPYFSNVSLLLKADGTNGSTTFTDSSANSFAISRTGNTVVSTAQSKFGGSSTYFDGNGDYLSVSSSANLEFGSGNYTIEMWINPAGGLSNGAQKFLFGKRQSLSVYGGVIGFLAFNSSSNAYRAYYYVTVNGTTWVISAATDYIIPANTWTHLAFVRNGNTFTVFVNGNSAASGIASGTIPSNSQPFVIGSTSSANPGVNGYAGYIDDLRVTKGIARYTANFTPPDSHPTTGV